MPRAERDLEAIFLYIQANTSAAASKWFNGLVEAAQSLAQNPHRSPATPEALELHHLLYGNKPHIYRIIYAIDDTAKTVNILHIRHRARSQFHIV